MHIHKISYDQHDNQQLEKISLPVGAILVLDDGSQFELSDRGNGYLRVYGALPQDGPIMETRLLVLPDTQISIHLKIR